MKITILQKGQESVTLDLDQMTSEERYELSSESIYSDAIFSTEAITPDMGLESMPRLSGIKPIHFFLHNPSKEMTSSRLVTSLDKYMAAQKENVNRIKEYLEKKKWVNVGMDGLSKNPTLWTSLFKVFGNGYFQNSILQNSRKNVIEKTYDGLKVVWLYHDNSNDSLKNKIKDKRTINDQVIGFLVLSKPNSENYFTKQITPRLILKPAEVGSGKSKYQDDRNYTITSNSK